VDHVAVSALVEVLQSYAACRGLAFMGCNFADEALQAVSSLLLMGCGKWWTGPKLQLLEITCQGNTQHTGRHSCAHFATISLASQALKQKRKEKTTPFGVNLMRSQVLYRAAQGGTSARSCSWSVQAN